jgi:hypothetical protein
MRKLAMLTFQTLDEVMQEPTMPEEGHSDGFADGGWADPFWDEFMALVGAEAMAAPYDVLFERKTYDTFAEHATDEYPMHHAKICGYITS